MSTLVVIAFSGKQIRIGCDASGIDCVSVSFTDHMQHISDISRKKHASDSVLYTILILCTVIRVEMLSIF